MYQDHVAQANNATPVVHNAPRWIGNVLPICIIFVFLALAVIYSVITPIWESPDEYAHYDFIVHLLTRSALPEQKVGVFGEAHQPPLYYFVTSVAVLLVDLNNSTGAYIHNIHSGRGGTDINWAMHTNAERFPYQGQSLALHLARGVSIVLSTATVALTLVLARIVFPEAPLVHLLATTLVAFNPQFLFIGSSVNNDNLLILLTTAFWLQILYILKRPRHLQLWFGLGLWTACAILSKTNGLVLLVAAAIFLCVIAFQQRSRSLVLNAVFALSVPVLGITGWWFARNQVLYGDPLGWSMYTKVFSINLRQNAFQWSDLGDMLIWQFRSFWGVFGWMNILLPNIYYTLYLALCAIALVSVMYFFARSFHHLSSFQAKSIAWFIVFIILQEAYLLTLNTRCNASCYQGRYLFPVISLSAVVIGWGISNLLPRRIANLLAVSLMLGLLMVAVFIPFGIIGPAY